MSTSPLIRCAMQSMDRHSPSTTRAGSFDRRSDQHNCGPSPPYQAATNRSIMGGTKDGRVSVAHVPLSLHTRAVIECGGHTFTLPCQLCERVLAAQFPIAIRTTRLQTNIGERTMRSRHPAFRVSTNSGRHEILSPLVHGRWSAFPFESFLQRQASPRQNRIENANSFLGTPRAEPFQRQILPAKYG